VFMTALDEVVDERLPEFLGFHSRSRRFGAGWGATPPEG
jgi:hypothetical protein